MSFFKWEKVGKCFFSQIRYRLFEIFCRFEKSRLEQLKLLEIALEINSTRKIYFSIISMQLSFCICLLIHFFRAAVCFYIILFHFFPQICKIYLNSNRMNQFFILSSPSRCTKYCGL